MGESAAVPERKDEPIEIRDVLGEVGRRIEAGEKNTTAAGSSAAPEAGTVGLDPEQLGWARLQRGPARDK